MGEKQDTENGEALTFMGNRREADFLCETPENPLRVTLEARVRGGLKQKGC